MLFIPQKDSGPSASDGSILFAARPDPRARNHCAAADHANGDEDQYDRLPTFHFTPHGSVHEKEKQSDHEREREEPCDHWVHLLTSSHFLIWDGPIDGKTKITKLHCYIEDLRKIPGIGVL